MTDYQSQKDDFSNIWKIGGSLDNEIKFLNELINRGRLLVKYPRDSHIYEYIVDDDTIVLDGIKIIDNTVSNRKNKLNQQAQWVRFIENALSLIGININDLGTNYDIICSSDKNYIVFCKKNYPTYTFVEFVLDYSTGAVKTLNTTLLDKWDGVVIYDCIDFESMKIFRNHGSIEPEVYKLINQGYWLTDDITQNDLYDIGIEGMTVRKGDLYYSCMMRESYYVGDFDIYGLDTNFCNIVGYNNSDKKPKIYCKTDTIIKFGD